MVAPGTDEGGTGRYRAKGGKRKQSHVEPIEPTVSSRPIGASISPEQQSISSYERGAIGLINDRITFDGFFSLILEVTCRDLNLAIPWTALQTFNYNDDLELEVSVVHHICSLEMNKKCLQLVFYLFLTCIFLYVDPKRCTEYSKCEAAPMLDTKPSRG